MAKNKMGLGKKSLLFVAAMMGLAGSATGSAFSNANQYNNVRAKDQINQRHEAPKPTSFKNNFSGGDNPYKHYRKGLRNQRQYRKWMKQVPQMRRSKKCKL